MERSSSYAEIVARRGGGSLTPVPTFSPTDAPDASFTSPRFGSNHQRVDKRKWQLERPSYKQSLLRTDAETPQAPQLKKRMESREPFSSSSSFATPTLPCCLKGTAPEINAHDLQQYYTVIEKETDPRRLEQRQKQIDMGKNTLGYDQYTAQVPKARRSKADPATPDVTLKISKRRFVGLVRSWRRKLHQWDPNRENREGEEEEDTVDDTMDTLDGDEEAEAAAGTTPSTSMALFWEDDVTSATAATPLNLTSSSCIFSPDEEWKGHGVSPDTKAMGSTDDKEEKAKAELGSSSVTMGGDCYLSDDDLL